MDKHKLFRKAIDFWGEDFQVGMLTEEIADVKIMLEQLMLMYDVKEVYVERDYLKKIENLEKLIKIECSLISARGFEFK